MYQDKHPSGWESGFFRLSAGVDNGNTQLFINLATREIVALPHDTTEGVWEPLYVYMGTLPSGKPNPLVEPQGYTRDEILNERQTEVLLNAYDSGEVEPGPSAAALRRRGLVNNGSHPQPRELTPEGIDLAKRLIAERKD